MARLGEDVTEVLDCPRPLPCNPACPAEICRSKYAGRRCDAITQAPAPALPTPRGRAAPGMLAHMLVSKYTDHLPLYRQSEIYVREGLDLDPRFREGRLLSDWVGQAVWLLQPIVEEIRSHVFAAEKIHGDDTPVPVLEPGLGRRKIFDVWETTKSTVAKAALDQIAQFYAIEDKARFAPPTERLEHRALLSPCSMRSSPGRRLPNESFRHDRNLPRPCATSSNAALR